MRAAVVVTALAAATLVAADGSVQAGAPRTVDGRVDDWHGATSGYGGTWQVSAGELVYQDHLFDDLGADTGMRSPQHGNTNAPKGDYRYPADEARYGHNAADLLELRLAEDGEDLWLLARMSTLKEEDTTVVAVAFDTDGDAATGGGAWPHGAGVSAAGADVVLTLWGTGGTVTRLGDGAGHPEPVTNTAVETDNAHNAIEARVPRSVIGDAATVRVWAATGLWDGASSTWMAPPSGGRPDIGARPFNVAFRDHETGSFMEERQAAALTAGDITALHADVDRSLLTGGGDDLYRVEPGRFYVAILDEQVSIPPHHEGLSYDGVKGRFTGLGGAALTQVFGFYGRHQPYSLYVPSTYTPGSATALPAALVLHGHGGSHVTYNAQPGFLAHMGEGEGTGLPPMLLVTPLARGSSFYADWGEADTMAVLDDVVARFPVDEDRLYLTGYSMGGYGVYRLASLYPDRWAAAAVWAGYTGEFTGSYLTAGLGDGRRGSANIGNPVTTLENLRSVPLVHLMGTNDEIVPTTGQYAAPRRLAELGYQSRADVYPGYEHFSFALVDDWQQVRTWLGDRTRATRPRQVTYRFSDGWTAPGLADQLGLVHDGAYWLSGLTMREPTEDGLTLAGADAVSHGVTAPAITPRATTEPATSPTPHVQHGMAWDLGPPLPVENRLELRLTGVGTATVDLPAAGLDRCGMVVEVTTDGPVDLRLVDGDHVDERSVPAAAEGLELAFAC
ncbi:MAG: prolyl oligopeptidase family serine peptidase [Actinomycetota bacterium]